MEDKDIAIRISHLHKTFKLPHEKSGTLKSTLINFGKRGYTVQEVLKDFSLDIKKGDFLGILGRNGCGKSTLLKTLSGIYTPNRGTVTINGKLVPFIELGVGFNPELTGRDNVFLNGALLGFTRNEVADMYDDIVGFAELESFMDQKLKNYSSGMQVRLAFSIAIRANTDILVLDEVLAVGDEAFQRKCYDYFDQLKHEGKTVILVTHAMAAVERFCTRAIVIDKGRTIYDGDPKSAANTYKRLNFESTMSSSEKNNKKRNKNKPSLDQKGVCSIIGLNSTDSSGKDKVLYKPHEPIVIQCKIKINKPIYNFHIFLTINNPGGLILSALDKTFKGELVEAIEPGQEIIVEWELSGIYNDGKYLVSATITDDKGDDIYSRLNEGYEFDVFGWEMTNILLHANSKSNIKVLK